MIRTDLESSRLRPSRTPLGRDNLGKQDQDCGTRAPQCQADTVIYIRFAVKTNISGPIPASLYAAIASDYTSVPYLSLTLLLLFRVDILGGVILAHTGRRIRLHGGGSANLLLFVPLAIVGFQNQHQHLPILRRGYSRVLEHYKYRCPPCSSWIRFPTVINHHSPKR